MDYVGVYANEDGQILEMRLDESAEVQGQSLLMFLIQ